MSLDLRTEFDSAVRRLCKIHGKPERTKSILKRKSKDAFYEEAARLLKVMREMRMFLQQTKRAYTARVGGLSEKSRDEVDMSAQECLASCRQRIEALDEKNSQQASSSDAANHSGVLAHKSGVVSLLLERLSSLQNCSLELKKFRYKEQNAQRPNRRSSLLENDIPQMPDPEESPDLDLDEDERQLLEEENMHLKNHFEVMLDDVSMAERTLTDISTLSQFISTKLAQQEEMIDELHQTAVTASENISSGNQFLEQAADSNVYFRFHILIFFLVASFVLLFLNNFYE